MIGRAIAGAFVFLAASVSGLVAQQQPFPHEDHRGLFPVCTSCHNVDGTRADLYLSPASCANCHDGTIRARVEWTPPPERASLLDFSHTRHAATAADDAISCEGCHVAPGENRMMVEGRTFVGQCLSCHGHEAPQHLTGAPCATCHVPLARSSFGAERVLELPMPPGHSEPGFLLGHSGTPECSVCHTRERCTTCHVNAATLADVQALPPAGPALELPQWQPAYPVPQDHTTGDWLLQHGAQAGTPAACSTCHTRDTCSTCHVEAPPAQIAALPAASHVQARGVTLARSAPESHASASFATSHGPFAETAASSCTACHGRTECAACHDAAANAGFHPPNFMERHPSEAFARRLECANCHDVEVFCTSCHQSLGRAPSGVTGAVYHDAEAAWLLRHGQAARQGLESCVGCHRPPDCLRCHSQLGAFQVSPHGPDFDAELARKRNPFTCRNCHIRDPLRGGG